MDINTVLGWAGAIAGSGAAGYAGAFFQFRMKLENLEATFKTWREQTIPGLQKKVDEDFPALAKSTGRLALEFEGAQKAWRLEFEAFREAVAQDLKHQGEIFHAEERGRESRPDPMEDLYFRLGEAEKAISRLRDRAVRKVSEAQFKSFTKEQESLWKEQEKVLAEIQASLK